MCHHIYLVCIIINYSSPTFRSFSAPLPTGTEGARCVAEILANLDSDQLLAPACECTHSGLCNHEIVIKQAHVAYDLWWMSAMWYENTRNVSSTMDMEHVIIAGCGKYRWYASQHIGLWKLNTIRGLPIIGEMAENRSVWGLGRIN